MLNFCYSCWHVWLKVLNGCGHYHYLAVCHFQFQEPQRVIGYSGPHFSYCVLYHQLQQMVVTLLSVCAIFNFNTIQRDKMWWSLFFSLCVPYLTLTCFNMTEFGSNQYFFSIMSFSSPTSFDIIRSGISVIGSLCAISNSNTLFHLSLPL